MWRWMARRKTAERVSTPEGATYISTNALRDASPITVEIQRPVVQVRELVTSDGHRVPQRSQEYWDVFADVTATIFEQRDDDPEIEP
jgi:hypothetical protein